MFPRDNEGKDKLNESISREELLAQNKDAKRFLMTSKA